MLNKSVCNNGLKYNIQHFALLLQKSLISDKKVNLRLISQGAGVLQGRTGQSVDKNGGYRTRAGVSYKGDSKPAVSRFINPRQSICSRSLYLLVLKK